MLLFSSYVIVFEFSLKVKEKKNRRHYLLTDPRSLMSFIWYLPKLSRLFVCMIPLQYAYLKLSSQLVSEDSHYLFLTISSVAELKISSCGHCDNRCMTENPRDFSCNWKRDDWEDLRLTQSKHSENCKILCSQHMSRLAWLLI